MIQEPSCRIVTLYSGSGGNATYVRVGDTAILIDAGKSARRLCEALRQIGSDVSTIRAIFITHDHHDHTSALEVLSKKQNIPIHMTGRSAEVFDRTPDAFVHRNLVRHDCLYRETVGPLTVTSFRTPHDSRMSVGYRVTFADGTGRERAVGLATDIGHVSEEVRAGLLGCEAVVLESNHDVDMLMKGPYPYDLKKRIRSARGHLSNRDSADFAAELAAAGTRAFLLAHLSEENNEADLALEEAERAIGDPQVTVRVAEPDYPVELLLFGKEGACAECEIYNPWNA